MAFTRSIVRGNMDHAQSPASGMQRVNELICSETNQGLFVTMFYALLDAHSGNFTYVNAGHNPGLLSSHTASRTYLLNRLGGTGMALGIDADSPYTQNTIHLDPGDFVLLYTDGVTEAINLNEDQFGLERLERTIYNHHHEPAERILDALDQALHDFCGATPPSDDITVLIARRL
jgi:sigma-B regulation protein RsbU (phosphoserine phosphatase)